MAKQDTKNERIAKVARKVLEKNETASSIMILESVNSELRNGAYKSKVEYILRARPEFILVNTKPSVWTLNQSIDADDSLGVE
jgi:hypothetical protein